MIKGSCSTYPNEKWLEISNVPDTYGTSFNNNYKNVVLPDPVLPIKHVNYPLWALKLIFFKIGGLF